MTIAILLPTYNEEGGIGGMIDRVRAIAAPDWNIYAVDSNSTDRTVAVIREKGVHLISLIERGKGIAIKKAFSEINDDFLVLIDSDLTYDASDIPSILRQLENYEVVSGSRFKGKIEPGSISTANIFGNKFLTFLGNLLFSKDASDVCTGMWGFTKKAYKSMEIDAPHFEIEVNFFSQAAKKGFRICEVPISYGRREGTSKLGILDGVKIAAYLVRAKISGK